MSPILQHAFWHKNSLLVNKVCSRLSFPVHERAQELARLKSNNPRSVSFHVYTVVRLEKATFVYMLSGVVTVCLIQVSD